MGVDKFTIPSSFTLLQSLQLLLFISQSKYQNYRESYKLTIAQTQVQDHQANEIFLQNNYKNIQNVAHYLKSGIKLIEANFQIKEVYESYANLEVVSDLRILRFDINEETERLKSLLGKKSDFGSFIKHKIFMSQDHAERELVESLKNRKLMNQRQNEMKQQELETQKHALLENQIRKEVKQEIIQERKKTSRSSMERKVEKRLSTSRPNLNVETDQHRSAKNSTNSSASLVSPNRASKSSSDVSTGLNAAILAFNGAKASPTLQARRHNHSKNHNSSNNTSSGSKTPVPSHHPRKSFERHTSANTASHSNVNNTLATTSGSSQTGPSKTNRREPPAVLNNDGTVQNDRRKSKFIENTNRKSNSENSLDPRLQNLPLEPLVITQIMNEVLVSDAKVHWDDICGLEQTKAVLKETVVYPLLRPDIFKGLREPVTGILLFGPPGTGKTMIGKCVASECNATFFSISSSTLLSKFLGESEKLIKALFVIAKKLAPSIIFIDEIDSLLSSRSGDGNENESSRRIKTELLIQWSNISNDQVLVLGATNLPWSIDEAARRRFSKKLYIPLPDYETRLMQLQKLLRSSSLTSEQFGILAQITEGYSSSDLTTLCKEAAMCPVRDLGDQLLYVDSKKVRLITAVDVESSLQVVKPSVSKQNLVNFETWSQLYGSQG
ncbi:hypothetical protein ACO0QE_002515 [Hanseniaspora vineae]